jgi:hypothetical protein
MPGTITILIYSFSQGSIESGSGTIVEILLNNLDEASTSFEISFSDVVVSDVQGNTVEIDFFEGTYFILDPSIITQPPLISDIEDVSMAEDDSLRIPLIATDQNVADLLSFSAISETDEVDLQIIDNDTLSIKPEENWVGITTITAIVTDGLFNDSTSFTVTVNAVNDAPVANAASATTNEDQSVGVTLSGNDIDGDDLSFNLASDATNGSVLISGSVATYTPSQDFNGSDSFTFTANDGELSDEATVTILITAINDAPVLTTIGDQASYSGETIELSATDVDGDNLTYTVWSDAGRDIRFIRPNCVGQVIAINICG